MMNKINSVLLFVFLAVIAIGCDRPSSNSDTLRKENTKLRAELADSQAALKMLLKSHRTLSNAYEDMAKKYFALTAEDLERRLEESKDLDKQIKAKEAELLERLNYARYGQATKPKNAKQD